MGVGRQVSRGYALVALASEGGRIRNVLATGLKIRRAGNWAAGMMRGSSGTGGGGRGVV